MPKVQAATPAPRRAGPDAAAASSTSLAEINVVPLVDVMLVLLIIFMVAAPMIQRGVDVNLPVARRADADRRRARRSSRVPLSYRQNRTVVYLGEEPIRVEVLQERVRQKMETAAPTSRCTCAATAACSYQDLMDVFDRLKAAGVEKVGMVTEAAGRTLTMDVTDVLRDRMQRAGRAAADGRRSRWPRTWRWSRRCHARAGRLVGARRRRRRATVMTISLGGGGDGPRQRRHDADRRTAGAGADAARGAAEARSRSGRRPRRRRR